MTFSAAPLALIGPLGAPELLIIALILVLLFGVRKLPELGKGLGEGIKNFRGAMKEMQEEDKSDPKGGSPS
ncbi:MAG: twin-arginine translocase TatA/TatE family subunit [Acidobacteriota bacterium]|nr:twin-arginine translocase TatA/TatE family subunit [Acidobacteriota bacterium]MDQ7086990.1 twin-arginine translocase TatA/TatE family subunit [Acidobacteriota bacterium]